MLVEIQNIDCEALGAILQGFDAIGLQELTNVFARWAFELDWPEIAPIPKDKLALVIRMLDCCRSYSMRFGEDEYTKRVVEDADDTVGETEVAEDENGERYDVSDDEPAPDLQTPEELQALAEERAAKAREIIKNEGGKGRDFSRWKAKKARKAKKAKEAKEAKTKLQELQIDVLETEQRADLVSLIREIGFAEVAEHVERFRDRVVNAMVPATGQIGRLREVLDALCTRYKVRLGAVRFISS
jgi:hypothetical protein